RTLVGDPGVLDRQIVEAKLLLDLLEQRRSRIVEADPHEHVRPFQDLADIRNRDVAQAPAFGVRDTGDQSLHQVWTCRAYGAPPSPTRTKGAQKEGCAAKRRLLMAPKHSPNPRSTPRL